MSETDDARVREMLARPVFVAGGERPFGELRTGDVRARADELRAAVGWGPTARIAPVARAWGDLATAMEAAGAETVADVPGDFLEHLAGGLWFALPG